MAADSTKTSRRVFEEIWNSKKLELTHEIMTSGYKHHDPQAPVSTEGIEAYKEFVALFHSAFPDLR
ncbi:MAG: ester cyclase, partial [Acidobacteriaceae bacterium]